MPLAEDRGRRVVVADIDEAALRREPKHRRLVPVLINGRGSASPSGAYDLAFVNPVLHHVEDLSSVRRALRRVVRPGGCIACFEFHPACAATRVYRVLSRFRSHPCTFYRPEVLTDLLGTPPFAAEHRLLDPF